MSCENGTLEMNISSTLGHPDLLHFPPAPPPPPTIPPPSIKRKPASQLRRKERRQQAKAQEVRTDDLENSEEPNYDTEAEERCHSSTSPPHTLTPSSPPHSPTLLSNQTSVNYTTCDDISINEEVLYNTAVSSNRILPLANYC